MEKFKSIIIEEEQDETTFLLSNEANRKHLMAGVEAVKQGRFSKNLSLEQIEVMAQF